MRVRAVGVCGSDLHGYLGHTGRRVPPLVMGHEATGEVVAVGSEVRAVRPGDRVATNTIAACGRCRPCLAGERSICEHRLILGMNAPGAYAEYVVWPEDSLPALPDGLSYEAGALAEPLAVALHGVNMAAIKPGDVVFIAGGGPIGVLVHLLVRLAGAGRIIVSDLHPERLASARAFGADVVVDAGQRGSGRGRPRGDGRLGRRRHDRGRRVRRHARARPSTPCATRAPSSGSATASAASRSTCRPSSRATSPSAARTA